MARRYIPSAPTSRLAIWARRMAGFAFLAAFLAVLIVRSGLLENRPALATFAGALATAVVALLLALSAFVVIWMEGLAGIGAAVTAMLVSLALLAYPAYLGIRACRLPWIYDITTDPIDPPRYEALARLRVRDANPTTYAGLYAAEQQRAAYPDVGPLGTNATVQAAYDAALAVVNKRRWRIVDARAPQAGRREGRVEAVARTPIMGFRDDVVIRVRAEPDGLQEPGIEPDIDAAHEGGDIGFALRQPSQDRGLAILAVANVVLDETGRLAHRAAVAGQVNRFAPARELLQRGHVIAHRPV